MTDILLVHDDLTTPQCAEHAPLERSQHTNHARRRGVQHSHAPAHSATWRAPPSLSTRTLAPEAAILAFCEPHASTRDHGAQRSRAHTYHAAGARIATRPARGTSLAAACERSGAHATVSTSTLTPGGNAMNTGTGIISCLCAACMHSVLLSCAGRFALTTRVCLHRSYRLRA